MDGMQLNLSWYEWDELHCGMMLELSASNFWGGAMFPLNGGILTVSSPQVRLMYATPWILGIKLSIKAGLEHMLTI